MTDQPFIQCENLVKIYKIEDIEVVALQGLDLTVESGELAAIIGPSGSGKSSLLNILGGLDFPSAGKAQVGDVDLVRMNDADRIRYRRKTAGFVWQNVSRNLIPYLNALENVEMPMILSGVFDKGRAKELLDVVGLKDRMRHLPSGMSGGEQQRVAIAIGLANKPSVLLADEPTGSLDTANRDHLLRVFDDVRRQLGVTIVIVTHDRDMAKAVDRYVEIRDGKTSREAVRRSDDLLLSGPGSSGADGWEEEYKREADTHEVYTLLDSAGRLQIPGEVLATHGIRDRVILTEEDDRIVISAPKKTEDDTS
ncbi:MAG: ABC transporter [Spirochaetales bacterium]|nr:ABC transporter [Spirochaetales bacterium]